jgi:hypothetical protein
MWEVTAIPWSRIWGVIIFGYLILDAIVSMVQITIYRWRERENAEGPWFAQVSEVEKEMALRESLRKEAKEQAKKKEREKEEEREKARQVVLTRPRARQAMQEKPVKKSIPIDEIKGEIRFGDKKNQ